MLLTSLISFLLVIELPNVLKGFAFSVNPSFCSVFEEWKSDPDQAAFLALSPG